MKENTERGFADIHAVDDREIRRKKIRAAKRERERKKRMRHRIHMLACGLAVVIVFVLAISTVACHAQMTRLSDEVNQKEEQIAQLDSEYISLQAKQQNAYDLSYVEEYAENVLGLVKMDRSQEEYLELQKTDQVEVNEASSGVDKLVSSFVKSFNAILSFLR